jgi:hypothetical protein
MWVLLVIQGSKLLHLLGVSSPGAASSGLLLLAYTMPFIRAVCKYLRIEDSEPSSGIGGGVICSVRNSAAPAKSVSHVHVVELLFYVMIASLAAFWARRHQVAHNVLEALMLQDPTDLQQTALCLAVWLSYLGCIMLVFFKSAKLIRRYL